MRRLAVVTLLAVLLADAAFGAGKHVILLIDDSRDMRGWRDTLDRKLPGWLFRGPDPSQPDTPRFDPTADRLSVLYYSLRDDGPADECKAARGDVISAETLLHLEAIDAADEESFRRGLRESLAKPCRFGGHLSPIVTSPTLALPYVQDHLPADLLFSRVLIVNATNDEYNFKASTPSAEMAYLVSEFPEYNVQVPPETRDQTAKISRIFNFDAPFEWSVESQGLHYRVIEVVPRGRTADAALVFNRRLQLDRVAAGENRIFGVPKVPGTGAIRIPRTELVPLMLEWQSVGARPGSGVVDLTVCGAPLCSADEDGVRVDLFDPSVNPFVQSASDAPFGPQSLAFRVDFRLDTGRIYDHIRVRSDWQRMELTPIRPASAWLLAYPLRADNSLLAKLWSRGDGTPPAGGLTHDAALTRVRRLNFAAWTVTILLLVFVIAWVARRSRVYAFEPEVEWQPAAEVVLDFHRPGHSRVLAGSVVVRNRGGIGWLGRRLGGAEQPTRIASISLDADVPARLGKDGFQLAKGVAIGFLDNKRELVSSLRETVSEGRQVHLFLAEDQIRDFARNPVAEDVVTVKFPVKLEFAPGDVAAPRYATVSTEISIAVRVKPEQAGTPKVTYERATQRDPHYKQDSRVFVGRLTFQSRTAHQFALPYRQSFRLATTCDQQPLAGSPIRLVPDVVSLAAQAEQKVAVELLCADPVTNPQPVSNHYSFALLEPHEADYEAKDLSFDLRRDRTRAEIELHLTYRARQVEVHWDATRGAWGCVAGRDAEVTLDGNVLRFAKPLHYLIDPQEAKRIALGIQVGNSAKSGNGSVSVAASGALVLHRDVAGMLHMRPDWDTSDILVVPAQPLVVSEGEKPVHEEISLRSAPIDRIDGGEIASDKCAVRIGLAVTITSDSGDVQNRSLTVEFPLHLEQSPGANCVVIDFGTSSIAAAVGIAGERNDNPLLDLQHVKVYQNESVATIDPEGPEVGTQFLPSWIVCDADARRIPTDYGQKVPPGFPRHTGLHGASLAPNVASFITLPAINTDLADRPGRVLLSLKTWLGKNAKYVPLPTGEISYLDGLKTRTESALPLDDLLEASYAALAQAYIKPHGPLGVGQVIICHPNTFSALQRERLRQVAWNALAGPLDIVAQKHVHLLSESDAVAYAYCADRMRQTMPSGIERILVYDLGAGTLDLSVITIEWNRNPVYPIFRDRHQLGVPIAGNYFDQTLARIIHELLSDDAVLKTPVLKYAWPVVTRRATEDPSHARASRALWSAIRQAKHQWKDGAPFEVIVGDRLGAKLGLVTLVGAEADIPTDAEGRARVIDKDFSRLGHRLVLSIPREQLLSHPRIVRVVDFVTRDVIREALAIARLGAGEIDTVIVSGRGALWPGLMQAVQEELPNARPAPFTSSETMKAAVARGAIARQDFIRDNDIGTEAAIGGRLAVVYGHDAGTRAIFEDEWDRPITIPVGSFQIVDVAISRPDPARDLGNGSLRKHFYAAVGLGEYRTRQLGGNTLLFRKESAGEILIRNEEGDHEHRIGREDMVHRAFAAWPVGNPFLSPDEEQI